MSEKRSEGRARPGAEDVGRLIEAAGPRPPVPEEDLERIVAAARAEWRRGSETGRRRRAGWLAAAAALAAALGLGWWWLGGRPPAVPGPIATVARVEGDVRVAVRDGSAALLAGAELGPGAELTTATSGGAPGRVALRLEDGRSVRIDRASSVRLLTASSLELERGAVYVDSGPEPGDGGVEVKTALGNVREVGTQFEVRLAPGARALRIRVREGEVAVTVLRGGGSHAAAAGEELTLEAAGSLDRGGVATHGEAWEWVLAAAPARDIDGMSLAELLDWVGREMGLEVRYEEPTLAARAPGIEVFGSGSQPLAALEVATTAAGLAYRIEDDTLWVGASRPGR